MNALRRRLTDIAQTGRRRISCVSRATSSVWLALMISSHIVGCHEQPIGAKLVESAGEVSGELAGDAFAGDLAGDLAGDAFAGELAGDALAGVSIPTDIPDGVTCALGEVRGPLWILSGAKGDSVEVESDLAHQVMERDDQRQTGDVSLQNVHTPRIYGHARLFRADHQVEPSALKRARSLSEYPHGDAAGESQLRDDVLLVIHGSPEVHEDYRDEWRIIEPLGRSFWLISAPRATLPAQFRGYLLTPQDKWDHRLPTLRAPSGRERYTARVTLWAPTSSSLRVVSRSPIIARALKQTPHSVDAMLGERELPLEVEHSYWSPLSGTSRTARSARLTTRPLSLTASGWAELLRHPHVLWAGPLEVKPVTLNAPSRDIMGTDAVTRPRYTPEGLLPQYAGWSGEGIRVGVMDSGIGLHPDFYQYNELGEIISDRVRGDLPPTDADDHGTTVAGILAGNGYASAQMRGPLGLPSRPFQWRGQAPLVTELYSHLMYGTGSGREDPAWTQIFDEQSAHLANHSHTFGNGYYTPETQGYDAFISGVRITDAQLEEGGLAEAQSFSHPPRPIFLAAGNNGQSPRDNIFMKLHGYYGLLVNLKNGIIVGSVNSNDAQHVDSSSLGPTLDGRVKPDVSAPGSSDLRPLQGFEVELGEIRLHARRGSGASDISWRWGRAHSSFGDWIGSGAFDPEETAPDEGVLRGETFGSYWTRVRWSRPEGFKAIDASAYEAISFEVRFTLPEREEVYHPLTPIDREPLPIHHHGPEVWMLRWGDDQGRGYDETRYLRYDANMTSGEWSRVRYTFDDEWSGEISRLRFTPAIFWGGIYTPNLRGGYSLTSGTSMASPAAAGVSALALSQLADQHGYDLEESPPTPALIRGLLTHTARDLQRTIAPPRASPSPDTGLAPLYFEGPDFATGYGLVDAHALSRLIDAGAESPRWYEGEVTPEETLTFKLNVATAGPLKVTLSWDDPPGTVVTPPWSPKLIHDLDLAVISPSGAAYGPWVLTPPPLKLGNYSNGLDELSLFDITPARRCVTDTIEELWVTPRAAPIETPTPERVEELDVALHGNTRCLDDLNPLEQVYLDAPEAGEYLVKVRGAHLGGGVQRFALVASQTCELEQSAE